MAAKSQSPPPRGAGIWPAGTAIGIAVLLVGLIVSPRVIAPLGGGIALVAEQRGCAGNRRAPGEAPAR